MVCSQVSYKPVALEIILTSLTQSEYFERICDSNFAEAATNTIDLSAEPLHAVQAMMIFLYGGPVEDQRQGIDVSDKLAFWVDLYTLADRAMIKRLITLAARKFQRAAEPVWASETFYKTCREIYSRLPVCTAALRGAVCAVIVKHLAFLSNRLHFETLLAETPKLAVEVTMAFGKSLTTVMCPAKGCPQLAQPWQVIGGVPKECPVCCSSWIRAAIDTEAESA